VSKASDPRSADAEGTEQAPAYRDDALSELMTGAYAATSMVSMSVPGTDANLPAPPAWEPTNEAPSAEALDDQSGMPSQLASGPHIPVEEDIEVDIDADHDEEFLDDVVQARAAAETVPLTSPDPVPLRTSIPVLPSPEPAIVVDREDGEPAAAISTDSGVVVTPQHAVGAKLTGAYPNVPSHLRSPAPKQRNVTPWIVGGAVVVALSIGAFMLLGNDTPSTSTAEPTEKAAAPASVAPEPETPTPAAKPEPTPSAPEAPSPADPPPAASQDAYAAAAARYEQDPTNEALLDMTLAACELDRGPDARAAFRKLVGGKARSKAVVQCREHDVDVASKVEGFTGAELAQQAQDAFDAGDIDKALELARQSNRTERNQPALQLIVRAHCRQKDKKQAKKMMRHVSKRARSEVAKYCATQGVKVPRK